MPANLSPNPISRILGIDVIRFFSFYAILVFHLSYALWAYVLPGGYLAVPTTLPFEIYARLLSFSGFTVIGISFFLFGLKAQASVKWKYLWLLLLLFLIVWNFTTEEVIDYWDIYPLLILSIGCVALVELLRIRAEIVAFFSFIVVSIPFWKLEGVWDLPDWVEISLFGQCHAPDQRADWPVLPWLAYPLLTYAVGVLVRRHRADFEKWQPRELLIWIIALGASLPWLGSYYVTPLGGEFACYIYRLPVTVFWAHQIWIWFLVRASLMNGTNSWLSKQRPVIWISKRQVNRRFFVVYFLHYPFVFAASLIANHFQAVVSAATYWIAFFSIALLLEIVPNWMRRSLWEKTKEK